MEICVFVSIPSGCCCRPETNSSEVNGCMNFINRVRTEFGEVIDMKVIPESSNQAIDFKEFQHLKSRRRNLKMPVVIADGKVLSIGRYPSIADIKNIINTGV